MYNGSMKDKKIEIIAERVEREFLPFVRRPARYIGGEVNQIRKDLSRCDLTVALCFPDVYEIGMSNTGMPILYHILNQMDNVAAERVFAPWTDAEEVLRRRQIPLFSLESKATLGSFDVIGFSLTNELCYTNVLNILDLAGLNVRRSDREEDDPLIIAGGGMANCCEPVAEFIDLFVLGEGEQAVAELAGLLLEAKGRGWSKGEISPGGRPAVRVGLCPAVLRIRVRRSAARVLPGDRARPADADCATRSWRTSRTRPCRPGPSSRSSRRSTSGSASRSCGAARAGAGSARPATAGVPSASAAPRRSSSWPRRPTTPAASTP